MVEASFPRRVEALNGVLEFVQGFFAANGIRADHEFEIDLIVEELFMNAVRHNPGGRQDIRITLALDGCEVTIVLRDLEAERFDITALPPPDLTRPLHERAAGGLGVHLVRGLADTVRYEHVDGGSTITVTKRLEI